MEVLSHTSVKKRTKRLTGLKFRTFNGRFQVTSHIEGVKVIASMVNRQSSSCRPLSIDGVLKLITEQTTHVSSRQLTL